METVLTELFRLTALFPAVCSLYPLSVLPGRVYEFYRLVRVQQGKRELCRSYELQICPFRERHHLRPVLKIRAEPCNLRSDDPGRRTDPVSEPGVNHARIVQEALRRVSGNLLRSVRASAVPLRRYLAVVHDHRNGTCVLRPGQYRNRPRSHVGQHGYLRHCVRAVCGRLELGWL